MLWLNALIPVLTRAMGDSERVRNLWLIASCASALHSLTEAAKERIEFHINII